MIFLWVCRIFLEKRCLNMCKSPLFMLKSLFMHDQHVAFSSSLFLFVKCAFFVAAEMRFIVVVILKRLSHLECTLWFINSHKIWLKGHVDEKKWWSKCRKVSLTRHDWLRRLQRGLVSEIYEAKIFTTPLTVLKS